MGYPYFVEQRKKEMFFWGGWLASYKALESKDNLTSTSRFPT